MEVSNLIHLLVLFIFLPTMDYKHKIIQWNCRGLKPKFDEISLLVTQQKPSVFCLQETFLKPDDKITLKGFSIYNHIHSKLLVLHDTSCSGEHMSLRIIEYKTSRAGIVIR